jgi:hypothetical protein
MLAAVPAQSDGLQSVTITDPVSGAFSIMTNVLTFGAASTDRIILLQGGNPPTPVGTQATNPVTVRVVASDGVTPVSGATVGWSATNATELSTCGGASACSATSDESGIASTWIVPAATGNASITATLAPGVYSPPQSVTTTMSATSSSLDIGVATPYLWIAQAASLSVPLGAWVMSLGVPQSGTTVNFAITQGSGSLSGASAVTNGSGYASVTLTLTNFTANVQLKACVAPGNAPCQIVYGNAVAPTMFNLQAVSGAGQVVTGAAFQPLTVRVTDSSTPPNPVLGASVLFQSTMLRPAGSNLTLPPGGPIVNPTGTPDILSISQSSAQSDINGLASMMPSMGSYTGPLEIEIQVSAGSTATLQDEMEAFPSGSLGSPPPLASTPLPRDVPARSGPARDVQ